MSLDSPIGTGSAAIAPADRPPEEVITPTFPAAADKV
jgi:hypothetical protein